MFLFPHFCCKSDIRLVNGTGDCNGRVEIYHDGQWGTVCGDNWDMKDAEVVCRQVGCGRALSITHSAHFGEGNGPVLLDDVGCSGDKSNSTSCSHGSLRTTNCSHREDARIVCSGKILCKSDNIRLGNGTGACNGRVEIYHHGQWGTVCGNNWDMKDAEVVCRQVGCGRALSITHSAHFGEGNGPVLLDDVGCSGQENNLTSCSHGGFGITNCSHSEDAGVICSDSLNVRLVGGTGSCSGRVEVYYRGQWGTVCDDDWDMRDAAVVCRQMGCGRALRAHISGHFGKGTGLTLMDNVGCSGNESSIRECRHNGFGKHDCNHGEDAGVTCSEVHLFSFLTDSLNVRLIDGTGSCSGRVEVYYRGQWGTVCDDDWDINDAEVVCRQMGCGGALSVHSSAHFGQGTGPILLDNVGCSGNESSIGECRHSGFGKHVCNHGEDAGVTCSGKENSILCFNAV
ncbi:deleted in malignant brain tumors 1 protein-like [Astyanax mexicanus]|uniref:Deleted in malignant brain tumors 1 protein-like n=1 Tax=Astyanax mexicanus TaxID=7994 RepID=A0A8T2KYV9_ASTMX|nr:deleted in malignant brain tumors 1 protein-like [Astyanax mexicanus]